MMFSHQNIFEEIVQMSYNNEKSNQCRTVNYVVLNLVATF